MGYSAIIEKGGIMPNFPQKFKLFFQRDEKKPAIEDPSDSPIANSLPSLLITDKVAALYIIRTMCAASDIFSAATIHKLLEVIINIERENKEFVEQIINRDLLDRLKNYTNQDVNSYDHNKRDEMKMVMDLVKSAAFVSLRKMFSDYSSEKIMKYLDICSLKTTFASNMRMTLSQYIKSAHNENRCLYGLHGFLNETLVEIERHLRIAMESDLLNNINLNFLNNTVGRIVADSNLYNQDMSLNSAANKSGLRGT